MPEFVKSLLIVLAAFNGYFILSIIGWSIYYSKTIGRPEKSTVRRVPGRNLLIRLFVDFPRQFAYDKATQNPNIFPDYGLHMVCGKQGSGKTITVAYLLRQYQRKYPKLITKSNFGYKKQHSAIKHWKDITLDSNGIYGEVDVIDEIQNWFSSNASKDFPPEFLSVITQQRKVRRCILGTAQVFSRIGKPLREQTYLLYLPITLFGCLTIVRVYDLELDLDANIDNKKMRKVFCFVHDKELRESFDSYATVAEMAEIGFQPIVDSSESLTVQIAPTPTGGRAGRKHAANKRL